MVCQVRYSKWNERPIVEPGTHQQLRSNSSKWGGGFAAIGLIALAVSPICQSLRWVLLLGPIQFLILFFPIFFDWPLWGRRLLAPRAILTLLDEPRAVEQFPVQVVYFHSGAKIGHDSGLFSFVEGSILFEGLASQFSIPGSFLSQSLGPQNRRGLQLGTPKPYRFFWRHESCRGEIDVSPYGAIPDGSKGLRDRFHKHFLVFGSDFNPSSIVLPPQVPQYGAKKAHSK
jgi:hypothetical protein